MKWNLKTLKLTVLLASAAAFMTGTTALGAEFTTPDFILTLETPDDEWKQVKDDRTWATLTDGEDKITLLHYSNGEKLPDMTVAGDGYAEVCQSIISTENEVFIITGSAVDREDFDEVREAVQSAVINKYDTKKAVKSASGSASQSAGASDAADADMTTGGIKKTVEAADLTVWVSAQQLNVRSDSSTDAQILGTLYYMDAAKVTGVEKISGKETGWYQINYNGSTGYIVSQYVTAAPSTAESRGYTLTSEQVTLYSADGSSAAYVYKATNGNWYDGSGRQYQANGSGQWTCLSSGGTWTETAPGTPAESAAGQIEVADAEGNNSQTLYQEDDGVWKNIAGGVYTDNGDGTLTGPDGTMWDTES